MEAFNIQLSPFFQWLLKTSLQGSLLIGLILLVKSVLRSKLPIRWHYYLWLVLLARLAMPWAPQSRLSMFNLVPQYSSPEPAGTALTTESTNDAKVRTTANSEPTKGTAEHTVVEQKTEQPESKLTSISAHVVSEAASPDRSNSTPPVYVGVVRILPLAWLVGAMALGGYVAVRNFNLWRTVKRERPVTNQKILELLEDCKMQMNVQTIVGVVVTDRIKSPALFGFVRPRLLLPQGLIEALDFEELHYVFLHELAHLKRRDIYLGWLVSLLQVMHWFNPLIWFALRRMRTDQELACDVLALSTMNADEPPKYGRTIVNLFERFSQISYVPSIAGILEEPSQLERRIKMIAKFKNDPHKSSPLAVLLIIILAGVSLPNAKRAKAWGITNDNVGPKRSLRQILESRMGWESIAISPNGTYICYQNHGDPNSALEIRELSTGKERILVEKTQKNDRLYNPVISPDSKTVAYYWHDGKKKEHQLRLIKVDGSQRRILHSGRILGPRDWSPDGKRIFGIRHDKEKVEREFVWVAVEDGSVQSISDVPQGFPRMPGRIDLSPDGRFLAYVVETPEPDGSAKCDLITFSTETGHEVRIEDHPQVTLLGWTPDGQHLFFTSERTGKRDAWLQPMANGRPQGQARLVYKNIDMYSPIGFTLDGDYYYHRQWFTGNVYTLGIDIKTGKVLEELKPVQPGLYGCPAWSPDGRYLAYCAKTPKNIHIRSLATGKERLQDRHQNRSEQCSSAK